MSLKENIIKNKFEENHNKKNIDSINYNKSKGLNRFNTTNNLSFQREYLNYNEINKMRMKSIDNMQVLSLNRRMKLKNIKLNSDPNNIHRLLSPRVTDFKNHKKLSLNDNKENNDNKNN